MTLPADWLLCPNGHHCSERFPIGNQECPTCGASYPLVKGVLQAARPADARGDQAADTVVQFGESWRLHGHMADYHSQQFLDWIAPTTAAEFKDQSVLEAGCGKGRHSRLFAAWGAKPLLAVDLSPAVYQAAANANGVADAAQVRFLQADLLHLPIADEAFDRVVCVGVLHHLADPQAGLRELWRVLKLGGVLNLWVYGREGNGWIVHLVDPIRKNITSKIPTRWLRLLTWPLSLQLYLMLRLFYARPSIAKHLPYNTYLQKIAPFPFREVEHIVLDHLCPPIAHYLPKAELERWFREIGCRDVSLRWHNRNSWSVVARK